MLSCRACTLKAEIWERPPQGRLRAAMSCAARLPMPPLLRVRACLAFHVRRTVARQIGKNVRRVPVPRAVVPITPWVHNKALLPRTGNPSPAWITDQKGGPATRSPRRTSPALARSDLSSAIVAHQLGRPARPVLVTNRDAPIAHPEARKQSCLRVIGGRCPTGMPDQRGVGSTVAPRRARKVQSRNNNLTQLYTRLISPMISVDSHVRWWCMTDGCRGRATGFTQPSCKRPPPSSEVDLSRTSRMISAAGNHGAMPRLATR